MEKIHQAVTEIWIPQVWQPAARPPARTVTTIPLQPGGLRGKKCVEWNIIVSISQLILNFSADKKCNTAYLYVGLNLKNEAINFGLQEIMICLKLGRKQV